MFKTSSLHRFRFVSKKLLSLGASTLVSRPSSSQAVYTPLFSVKSDNSAAAFESAVETTSSGLYFQDLLDKFVFFASCFFLAAGFKFPLLWLPSTLLFLQFRDRVSYKTQAVSVLSVLLLGHHKALILLAAVLGTSVLQYIAVSDPPKPQQKRSKKRKVIFTLWTAVVEDEEQK